MSRNYEKKYLHKTLLIKGFPILYQENFKKLPLKNSFDAINFSMTKLVVMLHIRMFFCCFKGNSGSNSTRYHT